MKKKKLDRRKFIKGLGAGAVGVSKLSAFSGLIMQGILNKAYAQANGINKMYLYIQQYGAPPRWMWDLPLTPDGDMSKFITTPFVGTRFKGTSRYTEMEYATTLVNGIHMPWLWGFDVATPGGGFAPMANLMDGMMIIRGANSTNPGHAPAARLHYVPLGSNYSVSALASDVSNHPIPGITVQNASYEFRSRKGLTSTELGFGGSDNLIVKILKPFEQETLTSYQADQDQLMGTLETGLSSLDTLAKENLDLANIVEDSTKSAMSFFGNNFGDLDSLYNSLYNKYRDLIKRSIDSSRNLAGFTDKPVGTTGTRGEEYNYGPGIATRDDLRGMITNSTNMNITAGKFAFMEFALTNELTSSLCIGVNGLSLISPGGAANSAQYYDEHSGGLFTSLFVNMSYNMGLSSCLLELINQLKAANLFNKTVIDLGGEFGRLPRGNGSGSDHSAEATSNMILSGLIEGSHVVGNIVPNGGGMPGTWGFQGVNPTYGLLNVGHVGASIASLLGAESPVTAVPSLMQLQSNGKFRPALSMGKIVD